MGSLDENGSPIAQTRASIRNIGYAFTESADRIETSTTVINSGVMGSFGPRVNVEDAQLNALRLNPGVKISRSTDDSKVQFVSTSGLLD